MELITENGNTITEFTKDDLTFVEGRKGSEYKIKVINNTWTKIKVVISVDGLDIVTGQRAKPNAGGYVLNAYETQVIEGWRINDNEVRKFFFTNKKNSYNNKTGNDINNLGVIGILAYKLHVQPIMLAYNTLLSGRYKGNNVQWDSYPSNGYNLQESYGAVESKTNSLGTRRVTASVGTGMGAVKESKVVTVNETFETTPYASIMMYYKTKKELEAMGIKVAPVKNKPLPSAFEGYCQQV